MKKITAIFVFIFTIGLFAVEPDTKINLEEEIIPNTVDISQEVIKINRSYARDLASDLLEEDLKKGQVEFWSLEDKVE
jgi:hypothetical protein